MIKTLSAEKLREQSKWNQAVVNEKLKVAAEVAAVIETV